MVNFSDFLKRSLHPYEYLDLKLFKKFKIVHGNLDWNDFDLCFPVSDLHEGNMDQRGRSKIRLDMGGDSEYYY